MRLRWSTPSFLDYKFKKNYQHTPDSVQWLTFGSNNSCLTSWLFWLIIVLFLSPHNTLPTFFERGACYLETIKAYIFAKNISEIFGYFPYFKQAKLPGKITTWSFIVAEHAHWNHVESLTKGNPLYPSCLTWLRLSNEQFAQTNPTWTGCQVTPSLVVVQESRLHAWSNLTCFKAFLGRTPYLRLGQRHSIHL